MDLGRMLLSLLLITSCTQMIDGNDDKVRILFVNTKNVALLDTSSGNVTVIDTGYSWSMYVDYHYDLGFIYVGDHNTRTITRIPFPPKDGGENIIIEQDDSRPVGLTVDSKNDYIYWMDDSKKFILRANLDGSNKTKILKVNGYTRGVAVDVYNEWIYFGANSLQRCKFDGSQVETIAEDVGYYGNIALDIEGGRMYWIYNSPFTSLSVLRSATLNGSDIIVMHTSTDGYLFPVDISGNYIYFANYNHKLIYRKNRYDVTSKPELLYTDPNGNIPCLKVFEPSGSENECYTYTTIKDGDTRSVDFFLAYFEYNNGLSDHRLQEGWYRIISHNGDNMPNYPPGVSKCGTFYPVWLNGTLPGTTERNKTVKACVETTASECEYSVEIRITNCGKYYVYHLQPTIANSSYCFGDGPVRCPQDLSSESGFYPGCSSSYPNDTISPEVKTSLAEGPTYILQSPSLLPVFQCLFNVESNSSYVYDIYWYINADEIVVLKNTPAVDINISHLNGSSWVTTHRLNMEVWCSVRIRYSVNSLPSPFYHSPIFKAGLFPEKDEYTVIEGEPINITLKATVPVGCLSSNPLFMNSVCGRKIVNSVPKKSSTGKCSNNMATGDIVFQSFKAQSCGIVLETSNTTQERILQVYGFSDGKYNFQDRSTYIRLSTNAGGDSNDIDIWANLTVPDIKVNVIDQDTKLSGRLCQCYNDPHFRTFDGRVYHYMEVGEFALYRNDKGPYWVHALFSNCGYGWTGSSCNCGIAVRSRNSLFVIRTCKKVSRTMTDFLTHPHIEKRSCDESDFYIDIHGNHYTIKLPIGTEIRFSVSSSRFIPSISIKPSIYDIDIARGLCGVPSASKDTSDDFIHKKTGNVVDEKSFADSWRLSPNDIPNEQLFIAEPSYLVNIPDSDNNQESIINEGNSTFVRYCVCEREAKPTEKLEDFYSFNCNLTEPTDSCSKSSHDSSQSNDQNTIGAIPTSCSLSINRKKRSLSSRHHVYRRSLDDSDDVIEPEDIEFDENVESNDTRNETLEFKDGWTEATAREICEMNLNNTVPTDIWEDDDGINGTDYIESCILDIQMTASTVFVEDTVSAMQTYTLMEVLRNETLENATTDDGSQTILDYITSQLCPGNCNNNGNCSLGSCYCFDGFYGEDCSGTTSTPPRNYSLPSAGLCGSRSRACKRTNIYGNFPSDKVWCKKRYFQITGNVTNYAGNHTIEQAIYRNQFMVSVDISPPSVSRRKRSTGEESMAQGYEIGLSNDGTTFGESVNFLIYDEGCSNCNPALMTCVSLGTCPDYASTDTNTPTEDKSTVETSTRQMKTTEDQSHFSTGRHVDTTTSASLDIATLLQTTSDTENEKNVPEEQTDIIVQIVGATVVVLVLVVMVILVALMFKRRLTENGKRDHQRFHSESDHIQHDSLNMSRGKPREQRSPGFVQPRRYNSNSRRSGSRNDDWQKGSTFFNDYIQR